MTEDTRPTFGIVGGVFTGTMLQRIEGAWLVNCSGPQLDYDRIRDPLIHCLFDTGLARPDSLSLGLDLGDDCRLINKEGVASDVLFALGPPIRGNLWETTAVPDIRKQCEAVARHLTAMAGQRLPPEGECDGTRGRSQPLEGAAGGDRLRLPLLLGPSRQGDVGWRGAAQLPQREDEVLRRLHRAGRSRRQRDPDRPVSLRSGPLLLGDSRRRGPGGRRSAHGRAGRAAGGDRLHRRTLAQDRGRHRVARDLDRGRSGLRRLGARPRRTATRRY